MYHGSFGDARARIAEALAEYDPNDYLSHRAVSGLNPQTFCLGVAGWNEWFLDYPDRALQAALEGVAVARGQGYPQSVDQAIHTAAHTHLLRREPEATQSYLDSALAILASTGFLQRIAQLRLMRGWALASQTDDRGALTELSEGLAGYRANGARARRTNFLALMVAWISACGQICRWPLHHCRGARSCDTARIPCSPSATTKTAGSGPCVHLFPDKPLDHFPSVPKALPAPVQKSQPVPAR